MESESDEDEPDDLAKKLSRLHKALVSNASREMLNAARNYDNSINEIQYEVGGRGMV